MDAVSGFREFYDLLPRSEALARLWPYLAPLTGVEELDLDAALGRVLADEVRSPEPLPGFARSTVDGYAVRARDTFGASESQPALLNLAGAVRMGEAATQSLRPGEAVQVPTGGALPPGSDAVVMFEYTSAAGGILEVVRPVAPGENALRPGEDFAEGDRLLGAGHRLRPADLGALASVGLVRVPVRRRPKVGIISTGDEVVASSERPRPGQVRDVNSHVLAGLVREAGGEPVQAGIVPDEREVLSERVRSLLPEVDLLLLSGGSSVGARDHALAVMDELGPPGVIVHGLALKPGKPTVIGVAGKQAVFGLPGHPAAAAVVFRAVVRPTLLFLLGAQSAANPQVSARLAVNLASASGREEFIRVRLVSRPDGLWAEPVEGPSGFMSTFVKSDGFVVLPIEATGVEAGTPVTVELD